MLAWFKKYRHELAVIGGVLAGVGCMLAPPAYQGPCRTVLQAAQPLLGG